MGSSTLVGSAGYVASAKGSAETSSMGSDVTRGISPKTGSVGADSGAGAGWGAAAIVPPRAPASFSTAIRGVISFCCSEEEGIKEGQGIMGENLGHQMS